MSSKSRGGSGDFWDTLKDWFGGGAKPARRRGGKDMSGARGVKRGGSTQAANKRSASRRKAPAARKTKAAGRAGTGARKMRVASRRKR